MACKGCTACTQMCRKLGPNTAGVTRAPTWSSFKKPREEHTRTLGRLARSAGESGSAARHRNVHPDASFLWIKPVFGAVGAMGIDLNRSCVWQLLVSVHVARRERHRRQLQVSGFAFLQTVGIRLWRWPVLQSIKENTVEIKTRGMEPNRNKQVANAPE